MVSNAVPFRKHSYGMLQEGNSAPAARSAAGMGAVLGLGLSSNRTDVVGVGNLFGVFLVYSAATDNFFRNGNIEAKYSIGLLINYSNYF